MLEGLTNAIVGWVLNILTLGIRNRRIADKQLFEKLYKELPLNSNPVILLKDHDFNQAFDHDYLKPLNYIVIDWKLPINEFHCFRVESRKKKFLEALTIFIDELSQHTSMEKSGLVSIGLHDQGMREKVIAKIGNNLNRLSSTAYKSYIKFVTTYKKEINA